MSAQIGVWTFPRPFEVRRGVVMGSNGIVASAHPLASSTGLDVLRRGGSFMDAALAMAAVLNVVEPYNSNLGGDVFMIVYDGTSGKLTALNGSGKAPALATPDQFSNGIPDVGLAAATVPGEVDGWLTANERWGTWPLNDIFSSAIAYAESGFPANLDLCRAIAGAQARLAPFPSSRRIFAPAPMPGSLWSNPDLAKTLRLIAAGGRGAFYEGEIAERIASFSERNGGFIRLPDLAEHRTEVLDPISTTYRGFEVYEQPLVSQGHILLEELNITEGYPIEEWGPLSAETVHHSIEVKKRAFADKVRYSGDPHAVRVPVKSMLSKPFAAERRATIDCRKAEPAPSAGPISGHDTTYFCVVDRDGNAVSFIQSIFAGFGCGVVVEGTGMLMNNRLRGFSLDPVSPNCLAPNRRPVHTLNTYLICRDGKPLIVGGTPGGDAQVQTNLQVIQKLLDFGWTPQEAVEAPRWSSGDGLNVTLEDRFPPETVAELRRRGHTVHLVRPYAGSGHAQVILIHPESGAYIAGSDPRCDGCAMGW